MGATHDGNIQIDIILGLAARSRAGFGVPMFVAEISASERVLQVESPSEVDTLLDDGDITSAVADSLHDAMRQNPPRHHHQGGPKG